MRVLLIAAIPLVFGLLCAVLLARAFTVPLQELDRLARGIAAGDLKARANINSGDELGGLAATFNMMADSLDEENLSRRELEQSLIGEKEQLQVLLGSLSEGVMTCDERGRIVLMNPSAQRLTDWSEEKARGRRLHEVLPAREPKSGLLIGAVFEGMLADGAAREIQCEHEFTLQRDDGEERCIWASAALIQDRRGAVRGLALVLRDVTEKRAWETERQRLAKLEATGVLAGGIAHDFNNLLTGITANLSLIEELSGDAEQVLQLLGEASRAAVRARCLTQQLLTFAKGGAPIRKVVDGRSLLSIVEESVRFALSGSAVQARFHASEALPAVDIDEGQINQVLNNLTRNAVHSMPQGGLIEVHLSEFRPSGFNRHSAEVYLRISVQDEGSGISEDCLERIFDPYFTTKSDGTGLGLTVCHSIITQHQGFITVESCPGQGTVFHVDLPLTNKAVAERKQESSGRLRKVEVHGRLLVMDDEESILNVTAAILRYAGFEVDCSADGGEAISKVEEALAQGQPYRLAILDLTVPGGLGGQDVVGRLREIDPALKLVVASGYSSSDVLANYEAYGFHGMLAKPYGKEVLEKTIKRLLVG